MSTNATMSESRNLRREHKVVSQEEWISARKELLIKEKELTRLRDQLSRQRRKLPWVQLERDYIFDSPAGKQTLADLFEGRSQLVVYHFMFAPDWEEGCPSCSFWADNFNGIGVHLDQRDVTMVAISRAPLGKLEAFKKRMGWSFKWVSSYHNDFNYDYHVSFTPEALEKEVDYNYGSLRTDEPELPGVSVFYKDEQGNVFHTYSSYARGIDMLNTAYHYLDLVPKGRDEDRLAFTMEWVRYHDRYGTNKFTDAHKPYGPATAAASAAAGSCESAEAHT
jgi:predicted dithiol-disulfide oxidoreductase (DUF899 family)